MADLALRGIAWGPSGPADASAPLGRLASSSAFVAGSPAGDGLGATSLAAASGGAGPLDLDVAHGALTVLLGPGGSGKSALLDIVEGARAPSAGVVAIDDFDVTTLPARKRNLARVFRRPIVYERMTVRANLAFPLRNRGVGSVTAAGRVAAVAEALGLEDALDRRAVALDAEARQLVAIGRGLVRDDIAAILLDEPLADLAPERRRAALVRIKRAHARSPATMIYATRDPDQALSLADRAVFLDRGRILQASPPDLMIERPEARLVGAYVGAPGMNFIPCSNLMGDVTIDGLGHSLGPIAAERVAGRRGKIEIGARPEYLSLAPSDDPDGLAVVVESVEHLGRRRLVRVRLADHPVVVADDADAPPVSARAKLLFDPAQTLLYVGGALAGELA